MAKTKPKTLEDLPQNWKEVILAEAREGAVPKEWAIKIGLSSFHLRHLERKYDEFKEVLAEAVALAEAWWLEQGRKNLNKPRSFNAVLWYMNMKNLHGWKDKQDITTDGKEVGGVVLLPPKRRSPIRNARVAG